MPPLCGEIESLYGVRSPQVWRGPLPYVEIIVAVLGAFALAWLADLVSGRRGLFASSLVSAVAAVSGWFLAVRVFGASTVNEWTWVLWSLAGSTAALAAFFLFRSKR